MTSFDARRRICAMAIGSLLVWLPLITGAPAAADGVAKPDDVVAQVNGVAITRRMTESYRDVFGAFWSPGVAPPAPDGGLVKAVVDASLLAQEAVRRGLDQQPYVEAQLRYAEREVATTLFTADVLSRMGRGARIEAADPAPPEMYVGAIDGEPVTAYDLYEEDQQKPTYEFDDRPDGLEIHLWAWPLDARWENAGTLPYKIASVTVARFLRFFDKPEVQDDLAAWRTGFLARAMRSTLNAEAIANGRLPGDGDTEILAFDFATDTAEHAAQLAAGLRKGDKAESLGLPLLVCPHGATADYCRGDGRVVFDVIENAPQQYPRFIAAIKALPAGSVSDPIPAEPAQVAKKSDNSPAMPAPPDIPGLPETSKIAYDFSVAMVVDRRERRLAKPATPESLAAADALTAELLNELRAKATIKMMDEGH